MELKSQAPIQWAIIGLVIVSLIGSWVAFASVGGVSDEIAKVRERLSSLEETVAGIKPVPEEEVPPEKEKITLKALLVTGSKRYFDCMEKAYEAKYPNVDLEFDMARFKYGEVLKQIRLAAARNAPYDIINLDNPWMGEICETGYFSPVYSDDFKEWAEEHGMYPVFKKGSQYKGIYYGLWFQTDTRGLWIWKDVLHEAGYEMEDIMTCGGLLNALPDITKTAKEKFGMAGGLEYPFNGKWAVDQWYGWLYQLGGSILKEEDGKWVAGFNNKAGWDSLQFVDDLEDAGATFTKVWTWHIKNFLARKYAMTYEGDWCAGDAMRWGKKKGLTPEEVTEKIGFIPTTVFEGKKMRQTAGGWLFAVSTGAEHPDVARDAILAIFNNSELYAKSIIIGGEQPTSEWMWKSPAYEGIKKTLPEPWFSRVKEGVMGGVLRPSLPQYPEIQEKLWIATQKVVYEKATAEEALATAEKEVNELMKE